VNIRFWPFDLKLRHRWSIASGLGPGGGGGTDDFRVVFVELTDRHGVTGIGESAPSDRYEENADSTIAFFKRIDPARLSFSDVEGSMRYLNGLAPKDFAPKAALNIALLDGAAREAGKPLYDFLGLGFAENKHVTSFSIGLDTPERIREKVTEAEPFPVLKLKVGGPNDQSNLAALRDVAPVKRVRVDANEGWKTREEALKQMEWLAEDGNVEFVEQPMPASSAVEDLIWLKERAPLPVMADESFLSVKDVRRCAECFHAVNVKLVKIGGVSAAYEALRAAREAGLKTMIGCMIESSVLISAAAHLAELTDHLDIDGNLLVSNDPYRGATAEGGMISFAQAAETVGLRVRASTEAD